jgi:hypothetical protein
VASDRTSRHQDGVRFVENAQEDIARAGDDDDLEA